MLAIALSLKSGRTRFGKATAALLDNSMVVNDFLFKSQTATASGRRDVVHASQNSLLVQDEAHSYE